MHATYTSFASIDHVASDRLPVGAHLVTPRPGFSHHGIYVGGDRVIHYAGLLRLSRRGVVEEVSLNRFTRGRGFRVQSPAMPKFSGSARIERARSRLGERRYRLWSNNCEHFAEWCISGTARSRQIEIWQIRWRRLLTWLKPVYTQPRQISRPAQRISSEMFAIPLETME